MKTLKLDLESNPNIGSMIFVNNKFGLISERYLKKYKTKLEETFNVPFYSLNIAGTELIGVFLSGNDSLVVVPSIIFKEELQELEKICQKHDVILMVIDEKVTAIGNLIAMNNNCMLTSQEFSEKTIKELEKTAKKHNMSNFLIDDILSGSLIVLNDEKGLISPMVSDENKREIEDKIKIELLKITTNFGNNFITAGILMNNYGFAIGSISSPIEIYEIDNFLR